MVKSVSQTGTLFEKILMNSFPFKLSRSLLASALSLLVALPVAAKASSAPVSDDEIAAALKKTPTLEETVYGRKILAQTMKAEMLAIGAAAYQKQLDRGGSKQDAAAQQNFCNAARRNLHQAFFDLDMAYMNHPLLTNSGKMTPTEFATSVTIGESQIVVLDYFLGAAQHTVDTSCGREIPLAPAVAQRVQAATDAAQAGDMKQAESLVESMKEESLSGATTREDLRLRRKDSRFTEAMKLFGQWIRQGTIGQNTKWWIPVEQETRAPDFVRPHVRALLLDPSPQRN